MEAWKGKGKMIRTMDWKLVYYLNGEGELYHLANDPHELVNLYQEHDYAAIRNDLQNRLLQWCISSEDPLPGVDEQSISFNPH